MAVLNEAVWRTTSTDIWMASSCGASLPSTFLFALANVPMLMRHGLAVDEASEEPPVPPPDEDAMQPVISIQGLEQDLCVAASRR